MYALINSPDLKNLYCFWTLKYYFIVNRCVFLPLRFVYVLYPNTSG